MRFRACATFEKLAGDRERARCMLKTAHRMGILYRYWDGLGRAQVSETAWRGRLGAAQINPAYSGREGLQRRRTAALTPSFPQGRLVGEPVGADQALVPQPRVQSLTGRSRHNVIGLAKLAGQDFEFAGDPAVRIVGGMSENAPYGLSHSEPPWWTLGRACPGSRCYPRLRCSAIACRREVVKSRVTIPS